MNKKEMTCYESDASGLKGEAEKVVSPKSIDHVQRIVSSSTQDIVPRGAGSGFVGGCVPENSIVVDMSKMNNVLNFDPLKATVYVEAGATLKELNEKLRAVGFEFPINLSNQGISSIGGMIATNASGSRGLRYGRMKDWIGEVEMVNGRGELMKAGKADLMDVCGMEGVTGIIVGAKLMILPIRKRSLSIFQADSLDEALSVSKRLKLEKEVIMLQLFPPSVAKLLNLPEKYNVFIEFDSERGKIKGEEYKTVSRLRDKVFPALASKGYYYPEGPKLFFDKIKEFIIFLEERQIPYFAYLGEGIVHPFFKEDDSNREEVVKFIKKTRAKAGKFGIGLTRKYYLDHFEAKIIQRVKTRHDPFGKFNKNKMISFSGQTEPLVSTQITPKPREDVKMSESVKSPAQVGEEKSAGVLLEELKTPEEKMDELIHEVEEETTTSNVQLDKVDEKKSEDFSNLTIVRDEDNDKADFVDEMPIKEKAEVDERIKDYKQTFDSELEEEKRKQVEEFARNVSKEIVSETVRPEPQEPFESSEPVQEAPRPERKTDYDEIKDIMANKFGFSAEAPGNATSTSMEDSSEQNSSDIKDIGWNKNKTNTLVTPNQIGSKDEIPKVFKDTSRLLEKDGDKNNRKDDKKDDKKDERDAVKDVMDRLMKGGGS